MISIFASYVNVVVARRICREARWRRLALICLDLMGIRGIQAAQPVTQQKNTAAIIVYVVLLLLSLLMAVGFLSTDDGQGVGVVFAIVAVVFFVLLIRTSR